MASKAYSGGTVHDDASDVSVDGGEVMMDGPANVAVSFTPRAAKETSERLRQGADEAESHAAPAATSTDPYALVVDDDAIILMNACDILEEAGFRFFEAGSGDEALALLEDSHESITLLFTDVEMPGDTDGFALARHVAQHWPDIEIVVVSGRLKPEAGAMPSKATFISKPFSAQIVHDHLRAMLPDGKKPEPLKRAV